MAAKKTAPVSKVSAAAQAAPTVSATPNTSAGTTTGASTTSPVSSRWDLSNWTQGPVSLFQALGIKKGTVSLPSLQTQLTGAAATSAVTANANASASTNPGTSVASGGCTSTQTSSNESLGQQIYNQVASGYGWTSAGWSDIQNIVNAESGWCNTVQNPDSTAYGIGQFLNTTWAATGYQKTSNPQTQILAMYAYIYATYGTPQQAWAFHQANGYY